MDLSHYHIKEARILVIDDEIINIEIMEILLERAGFFNLGLFTSPVEAIKHYKGSPPDLVLLDLNMPVLTGFDVIQHFDTLHNDLKTPKPPILMITALLDQEIRLKALNSGARDFLNKPFNDQEVLSRVHNLLEMHLAHKANIHYSNKLEELVSQRTEELLKTQQEIIQRLSLAAEFKDTDTGNHTLRVGLYSAILAKQLGLDSSEIEQLRLAAPMHDVGKIGIPDQILLKTGKLTQEEWETMQTHTTLGYKILKDSDSILLKNASIIALTHHEKWDGSGYPYGIKGEDIHLYGRITAIVDVFDALTMQRPYKKAWSIEDSVHFITEGAGTHFDPRIVTAFNEIIEQLNDVRATIQ